MRHRLRYYRVEPQNLKELVALADVPSAYSIRIESIERTYMKRSANSMFDTMSLATVAEEFEEIDFIRDQKNGSDIWGEQTEKDILGAA